MFKSLFKRSLFFREYQSDYCYASRCEVQEAAKEVVSAIGAATIVICTTVVSAAVWIKH